MEFCLRMDMDNIGVSESFFEFEVILSWLRPGFSCAIC